jgi:hypothetical protein
LKKGEETEKFLKNCIVDFEEINMEFFKYLTGFWIPSKADTASLPST